MGTSPPAETFWTPERTEILRQLWNQDLSAYAITQALPGATRNSVISKARRLKLASRDPFEFLSGIPKRTRTAPPANRHARAKGNGGMPAPPASAKSAKPPNLARACILEHLGPRNCRYISGQPNGLQTMYCGNPTRADSSYCPYHAQLTHQPKPPRRGQRGGYA